MSEICWSSTAILQIQDRARSSRDIRLDGCSGGLFRNVRNDCAYCIYMWIITMSIGCMWVSVCRPLSPLHAPLHSKQKQEESEGKVAGQHISGFVPPEGSWGLQWKPCWNWRPAGSCFMCRHTEGVQWLTWLGPKATFRSSCAKFWKLQNTFSSSKTAAKRRFIYFYSCGFRGPWYKRFGNHDLRTYVDNKLL